MARKVEMQSIGTPAVLKIVETDVGSPGVGQVRLVQNAIGVNYVDVMVRTGLFPIRAIAQAGVDVVYDFVGKATFPVGVAAVRDGGVIAAIGAASGQPPAATEQMASRGIQIRAGGTPQHVHGGTVAVATEQLWDVVRADLFSDFEVLRYRFDQIGAAHADMESRASDGASCSDHLMGGPMLVSDGTFDYTST
ncbi:zinc-binding dehydrogenase [Sinorhizobium meliloti]|uniref:zinc-binding dehydrogenase n=1 Tax=Rhizobium meliloti TaxID=382 RepID=UPI001F2F21E7|nr:zinc-binding dehydrogenase [Sinorhizobium meliloti]